MKIQRLTLALLCGTLLSARVPLGGALARAGLVLPFTLIFAAASWVVGDAARGGILVMKTYLSALAALVKDKFGED